MFSYSGTNKKYFILALNRRRWLEAEEVLNKKEERNKILPEVPLLVSKEGEIFLCVYDAAEKKVVRYTVEGVRQEGKFISFSTKKTIE